MGSIPIAPTDFKQSNIMKKISDEIKQQVIELKQEGCSYNEISQKLGVGKGSVSNICQEAGLGKNIIKLTPEKIEECQKLYDEIGNIKKVAKITGISYQRLKDVITFKTTVSKTNYENLKEHRRRTKETLVAYKGGKCEKCGYDKCIEALDFHHIDPSTKSFGISTSNIYRNIDVLKREVDKCILVCANCHREIHYNENR